MRVVDHSNSGEDPTVEKLRRECSTKGLECSSPARAAVGRLLAIVRRCKGGKRVAVIEEERECQEMMRREKVDALKKQDSPEEHRPSTHVVSGCERQEMTFNLAAGLGLLSLIAASKTELDKTIELRRQMEGYLRTIKEENDSNDTTPKPSDPKLAYAVSRTTMDGLSNFSPYSLEDHGPSLSGLESGTSLACDIHCDVHEKEEIMYNLEEELAAELERLQLSFETGDYQLSEHHQAEISEVSPRDTANRSASVSPGEVVDDPLQDDGGELDYSGVPPLELERRLHEVLEVRQEERIKELEAHLECMRRRLQEKEVEVNWWKDTAKLFSKQVPESSKCLR